MHTASRIVTLLVGAVLGFGVAEATQPGQEAAGPPVVQQVVRGIPPGSIKVPKQSAVRPDGYAPASPPAGSPFAAVGGQRASTRGLHLIEGFEGFGSCPYWDPFGRVWTRGYGETEGISGGSSCISRSYGEANLAYRLHRFYDWAIYDLRTPLNQNQFDALDSFVWNLGAGIFTGTLRYDLQHRLFYAAARVMLQYDHAGGQVLEGLRTRRQAEVSLFLTAVHEESGAERKGRLHRELVAVQTRIQELRGALTVRRCRIVHGRRADRRCPRWAHEGRVAHKLERTLLREGAR